MATKAHRAHAKTDLKNPSRNLAPHPNYQRVCATHRYTYPKCITEVLAAIRNARAAEHVKKPAMILPKNFTKLNAAEQTFVVTDLERVARGRRPFKGLTAALDSAAHTAAVTHEDPTIATSQMDRLKIQAWGSIWAGDLGPLAADYDWMYNDGYSKHNINLGCQTPSSADCWGHRDNIIGAYNHLPMLTAGAGSAKPAGASLAEVMAAGTGKAPKFAYTWKDALDQGANGHRVIS
ncbi:MAG TPA: hypothetical protein VHV79_03195 [Mycobacteriales bacterium]|nr:hypothetical protein [Mycobacteriales bacterium]